MPHPHLWRGYLHRYLAGSGFRTTRSPTHRRCTFAREAYSHRHDHRRHKPPAAAKGKSRGYRRPGSAGPLTPYPRDLLLSSLFESAKNRDTQPRWDRSRPYLQAQSANASNEATAVDQPTGPFTATRVAYHAAPNYGSWTG